MHYRRASLILRLSFACLGVLLLAAGAALAEKIPVSVPIRFGLDKSVQFGAVITRHRNYYLDLVILFKDEEQRAQARAIAGEPTRICKALNNCGEPSTFKVVIRKSTELILEETRVSYGHYSYSASGFYRNILIAPLTSGEYTISVEILESGSRLPRTDTLIELSTDARERDLGP